MLKRLAAVLLAAPLALATASPAAANQTVTVSGCYGAVIPVCDVTVVIPVDTASSWSTPVCAGTCTWVTVPWPGLTSSPACLSYSDVYGTQTNFCV